MGVPQSDMIREHNGPIALLIAQINELRLQAPVCNESRQRLDTLRADLAKQLSQPGHL